MARQEQGSGASAEADRATRPTDQAPAGLGDTASVPSAWTPGPWRVERSEVVVCPKGGSIAQVWPCSMLVGNYPQEANARLIAAAPEMVNELRFVRGVLAYSGAESGYCMCGDPTSSHGIGSGHAPVDSHAYSASQAIDRIDALLAKIGGAA